MLVAARPRTPGAHPASWCVAAVANVTPLACSVLPGRLVPGGHPSLSHTEGRTATVLRHRTAVHA